MITRPTNHEETYAFNTFTAARAARCLSVLCVTARFENRNTSIKYLCTYANTSVQEESEMKRPIEN